MASGEIFRIADYDPSYLLAEQYRIAEHLRAVTGYTEIKPVGSTAVEGLIGKGDLDFSLGVARPAFADARADLDAILTRDPLQTSNDDIQGYRIDSPFDAALQLYVMGSRYDVFDRFLEVMAASADTRAAYNQLKLAWDGKPMDAYREAKSAFLEREVFVGNGR